LGSSTPSAAVQGHPQLRYLNGYAIANGTTATGQRDILDPSGGAHATWSAGGPGASYLAAAGNVWSAPIMLNTTGNLSTQVLSAMDDGGTAMVVFDQPVGSITEVVSRRFSPTTGWTAPIAV